MNQPIPFGKYYLLERINVGGMAEVFRGKAFGVEGFERLVAVKRILPNIAEDKDFIRMFIDEAKLAVQLNHANIAQIFDLGMVDSSYYIALEHVHGRDLRAIFDRCRHGTEPMPVAQACFVIMKVCEGLDYAHNKRDQAGSELNLVHRDVSPQNILVSFEGEVKLIDFGIAKAAGKGSKTQAGILKGKFGYMSPEQVRGLPINRRSDIFSCGIVLYELLTGERLFVGESDFSTLEKVRNVEILPPSTYNRKIPDELERIVLKALAKDVDDRYQNAIDLHDELQAFVYTAGEFYSRKDLAGWMKGTFDKEIEAESAKLEGFRQLRPPEPLPQQTGPSLEPPRRATQSMTSMPAASGISVASGISAASGMSAMGTKPPPIPPTARRRTSGPMAAVTGPASTVQGMAAATRPTMLERPTTIPPPPPKSSADIDLDWDEEELETAIYDDQQQNGIAGGWNGHGAPNGAAGLLADGSNKSPAPLSSLSSPLGPSIDDAATVENGRNSYRRDSASAIDAFVADADRARQARVTSTAFGEGMLAARPPRRTGTMAALAALVLLVAGGGVALFVLLRGDSEKPVAAAKVETGDEPAAIAAVTPANDGPVDPNTGFDLIVDPSNVTVKLDGQDLPPPPLQIRNLPAREHIVEITAPTGFFNKTQKIQVEAGKAPRVVISLDAMEVSATFESKPSGARVILSANDQRTVLGKSPQTAKLDPRKRYEVTFRRDGYVTATRPVELSGGTNVEVMVELENSRVASSRNSSRAGKNRSNQTRSLVPRDKSDKKPGDERVEEPDGPDSTGEPDDKSKSGEQGFLAIGSKPPCRIFIDGRDTGMRTPKKSIKLTPGKHRITLVNNEHSIKESFSVTIKSGSTTRRIKDWSDRLK